VPVLFPFWLLRAEALVPSAKAMRHCRCTGCMVACGGAQGLTVVPVESPRGTLLLAFGGYNGKYSNEVCPTPPGLLAGFQCWGHPAAYLLACLRCCLVLSGPRGKRVLCVASLDWRGGLTSLAKKKKKKKIARSPSCPVVVAPASGAAARPTTAEQFPDAAAAQFRQCWRLQRQLH